MENLESGFAVLETSWKTIKERNMVLESFLKSSQAVMNCHDRSLSWAEIFTGVPNILATRVCKLDMSYA